MPGNLAKLLRFTQGSETTTQRLFLQDPTGCLAPPPSRTKTNPFPPPQRVAVLRSLSRCRGKTCQCLRHLSTPTQHYVGRGLHTGFHRMVLLRKEVIQPHLPVRLPCYDFVPIASPTFDGSLHKGWATGFGCCRLS